LHGEIEIFNARGKHLVPFDPITGALIKEAVPGRRVDAVTVPNRPKFFDLYSRGHALADEIDNFIDQWHEGADPEARILPLHDYLGLTRDEYEIWVLNPDMLPHILIARREARTLPDVVNKYLDQLPVGGRASDGATIRALRGWLAERSTRVLSPGGMPHSPLAPAQMPTQLGDRRTLVVGRGISVQGTITDAERLVVEGTVEASLLIASELQIAQGGVLKGQVEVEDAEISGMMDGILTVKGTLMLRGSGQVIGEARCRRLQIEDGGQLSGGISMILEAPGSLSSSSSASSSPLVEHDAA
jgi:cytoskeletal protein CcmA (bactofilin family)